MFVRGSVCLCRSDIAEVSGRVGLCRMESPDCACWWRFCWSRVGQRFWLGMVSVQRFCEEGGRWVTFLCEKMDGVSGVSDVDDHEQVQPDRRIECFSKDV